VHRPLVSLPLVAVLTLALALSACGRKGPLDPPPAGLASPAYAPAAQAPSGAPPGPDGQPAPAVAPESQPVAPPGAKRRLPIDWLLD